MMEVQLIFIDDQLQQEVIIVLKLQTIPDVVYHEYGHAINGWWYGSGMQNGGQNEGYADIWAISLTVNPILGFGWDSNDPNKYVRRYDINKKVYPQDLVGQVHADGEIIAGCFWDTYLNLGNMTQMLDLFKYTLMVHHKSLMEMKVFYIQIFL